MWVDLTAFFYCFFVFVDTEIFIFFYRCCDTKTGQQAVCGSVVLCVLLTSRALRIYQNKFTVGL